MNYTKRLQNFKKQNDFKTKNVSKIWNILKRDFKSEQSNLRGYGLSTLRQNNIDLYKSLSKFINFPFKGIDLVMKKTRNILLQTLSWIIMNQDFKAGTKFGFDSYSDDIYDRNHINSF